jgi:hypothetical protein
MHLLRRTFKKLARVLRLKRAGAVQTLPGGRRVYHEYFVPAEVEPGAQWPWTARAYLADGSMRERSGFESTRGKACRAALAWAEATKKEALTWH